MFDFEDWNMEAQITIFFIEISILFIFWLLISPVGDYYKFRPKVLSILCLLLERTTTSFHQNEETFLLLFILRVEVQFTEIKVFPLKWMATSHVLVWHGYDQLSRYCRSSLHISETVITQFSRNPMLFVD